MKKSAKILLSVLAGLLVMALLLLLFLSQKLEQPNPVSDYDRRVEIWGTEVAGNSTKDKLQHMNINQEDGLLLETIPFLEAIVGTEYVDQEETIDTYTYLYEIQRGHEKTTYEDQPYLIPYLVEGADSAVIVIPGGGYGYKSIDGGRNHEGKSVALTLNEAGINAFVLWYRSNPYEYPIPQLDVQRAVRYLRYHAQDYGLDPEKIGLIGYSAGGYQVGSYINLIQGNDLFPEDYTPDEIDAVDDSVQAAAMIYPALTYRYNVPMLFASFDAELVRDPESREALLEMTDLPAHIASQSVPQFICYGTRDHLVAPESVLGYATAAQSAGCQVTLIAAEGQEHGFKQEYYMAEYLAFLQDCFQLDS